MPIIDTHIHLFDRPFALAFNADHIKRGPEGEVTQYENFRRTHDISHAFIICYEYRPNPRNNEYVLNLSKRRKWILHLRISEGPIPRRWQGMRRSF